MPGGHWWRFLPGQTARSWAALAVALALTTTAAVGYTLLRPRSVVSTVALPPVTMTAPPPPADLLPARDPGRRVVFLAPAAPSTGRGDAPAAALVTHTAAPSTRRATTGAPSVTPPAPRTAPPAPPARVTAAPTTMLPVPPRAVPTVPPAAPTATHSVPASVPPATTPPAVTTPPAASTAPPAPSAAVTPAPAQT